MPLLEIGDDGKSPNFDGKAYSSASPVLIDPAGKNLSRILNKYLLRQTGTVEIQVNGDWSWSRISLFKERLAPGSDRSAAL